MPSSAARALALAAVLLLCVSRVTSIDRTPRDHVPRSSSGCGHKSPVQLGKTTSRHIKVGGHKRSYNLRVPASYDPSKPVPLIISHHGWTCSAGEDEQDGGLSIQAEKHNFVVAYLNGYDDNTHKTGDGWTWKSWNGAGTVFSDSKRPGCLSWGGTKQYCYSSCASRHEKEDGKLFTDCDSIGCDWTTCVSSDDFNTAVLDTLESELCIDVTREYATGQSNGAIYTFHLGATMSHRLAAIAPISGSFMNGYITPPSNPMPVLDCTGTKDLTVPINDTTYGKGAVSNEGWIYETMDSIFSQWEPANGCTEKDVASHFQTSLDGTQNLYCWGKRCGTNQEAPVIRCAWNGGHNYFGNSGKLNSALVWEFLSAYTRPSHLGLGMSEPAHSLQQGARANVSSVPTGTLGFDSTPKFGEESQHFTTSSNESKAYYGNPADGCRVDESVLSLSNGKRSGSTCAPKASGCKVGGYRASKNGCPAISASEHPSLFPTCLALSPDSSAPVGAEFHCLLTCERTKSTTSSDPDADATCPDGAVCITGQLRLGHVGVCVYQ